MKRLPRYSAEVRDRAVRIVLHHETDYGSRWATFSSIASKIDCTSETLRRWVKMSERAGTAGKVDGAVNARLRALERENQRDPA